MRVLMWLDPDLTCGLAVREGRKTLAKVEDLCLVPTA